MREKIKALNHFPVSVRSLLLARMLKVTESQWMLYDDF